MRYKANTFQDLLQLMAPSELDYLQQLISVKRDLLIHVTVYVVRSKSSRNILIKTINEGRMDIWYNTQQVHMKITLKSMAMLYS
jgi:hypothetical protein